MPIEFTGCSFRYRGKRQVFSNLDFTMPSGRTILLGPNGAGKSTLLSLAASVLRPQAGTIAYQGLKVSEQAYRRKVAWLPQNVQAVSGLTAREQVAFVGWLKGMSRQEAWESSHAALARVEMSQAENRRSTELSGGQLRRVGVAQALVHGAELVLLDEPSAGLDPHQRRVFLDMLADLPTEISVVVSTHDVADLAEAADNVVVLTEGRIIYNGSTDGFLAHAAVGTPAGRLAEAAYSRLCGEAL